jgi:hypothetical protein
MYIRSGSCHLTLDNTGTVANDMPREPHCMRRAQVGAIVALVA